MENTPISGYRVLTEEEIAIVNEIKQKGEEIRSLLERLEAVESPIVIDSRALAIARTDLQTGFMWLVRSVTRPVGF